MRYQIRHALVQYGAETIIEDVNFDIHDHEKIAIVGRNGCGKTTLLKLIAGDITMANIDSDESCGIAMAGNQKIGYLRQISFEDQEITVENEILKVFEPVFACERRMKELTDIMETDHDQKWMYEYSSLQDQMEAMGGYTYRRDMETMFQKFGFDLKDITRPIGTFSGGQQTKVAFIKLLLSRPDIMLLDEPTNHLDLPTIEWLEGYLKNYNKAVVIVSHDRMFLDRIIDVTYEIEYHRIKRYPGNYTTFMKLKEEAALKQEKDYEEQQKEIKRLTEWIEKWRNTPTKVASVHSKEKQLEHMVLIEKPRRFDTKAFRGQFLPRTTSYTDVLTLKALEIGYDHVLSKVSFTLKKGERVAIIGENGKGKSTLLKTLMGQIPPLGGSYTVGTGVEVGYFDQQAAVAESMYPDKTVLNDFWDMYPTLKEVEVRNALGSFLFTGEEVFKTLGQLSGGEKKLEMDRRLIKDRIAQLNRELKEVRKHREITRAQREKKQIPVAAIVGYTNAGKSTLLNHLTGAGVLEEDKLFATLDPTTRVLELPGRQEILLTDTVGFIRKLPHHLIEAFKSTLEEAKYADYILHVVDASNPQRDKQMHIVYDTLYQLDIREKTIITLFNKQDQVTDEEPIRDFKADYTLAVSAKKGTGLEELKELFCTLLRDNKILVERTIAYQDAGILQQIRKSGELLEEEYRPEGIFIRAYVTPEIYGSL